MIVRCILGHVADGFAAETREKALLLELQARGHDAKAYRICPPMGAGATDPTIELFENEAPLAALDHPAFSRKLISRLRRDNPDVLIVKGADNRVVHDAINNVSRNCLIVSIIGGSNTNRRHDPRVHLILEEFDGQIEPVAKRYKRLTRSFVFPKYVDWNLIDNNYLIDKKYDVVNVGSFIQRKRQRDILPLAENWHICYVGDGPCQAELEAEARAYPIAPTFLGHVPSPKVYETVASSRIMVHSSDFEGFPRAFAEALSLGVPILARRSIFSDLPAIPGIVLAEDDKILEVASRLLTDSSELNALSVAARETATRWSRQAMSRAFDELFAAFADLQVVYEPDLQDRMMSTALAIVDHWRSLKSRLRAVNRRPRA